MRTGFQRPARTPLLHWFSFFILHSAFCIHLLKKLFTLSTRTAIVQPPVRNWRMIKNKNMNGAHAPAAHGQGIAVQVVLKPVSVGLTAMPSPLPARKARPRPRVELEPELEEIAALWPAAKRFEMARKFRRWARQLRVSGFILFHDSHQPAPRALPFLALRKVRLN